MIIPALCPVIEDVILDAAAASVSLTVPNGYEILFLEWSNVYGSTTDLVTGELTLVSGNGGYDDSYQAFGAASSTTNGGNGITILSCGDTDGVKAISSGSCVIFNRSGQEKVVIGTENYFDNSAGAGADDCTGRHFEGKDRDTSSAITSVTITPSAGNFAANSRFILRGLRTTGAPQLGSKDIVQFIGSHEVSGTEATITLPTIPSGYGMLWLFYYDLYGDRAAAFATIQAQYNSDTGNNYDSSISAFGAASSTSNGGGSNYLGYIALTDTNKRRGALFATIFNRASQEKVLIGTSVMHENGGVNDNDIVVRHLEAKWRNTSDEISSIALSASGGSNFTAGKVWLFGVKVP